MGLFGKKKENKNDSSKVAPPPVSPISETANLNSEISNNNVNSQADNIPMPQYKTGNFSAPSIAGENLNDIKNQVSAINNYQGNSQPNQNLGVDQYNDSNKGEEADSLFDFSELDIESPLDDQNEDSIESQDMLEHSNESHSKDKKEDLDLSFIKQKHNLKKEDIKYVTTQQFKDLLEIIENVKTKVKESSETHLKILDIKTEEDIEFENLRKDFQIIEDKLYQVDSIIFDN
ncbi:MAG: hypothetical protein ACOC16_00920 [Nanoarchaeota archaeon]